MDAAERALFTETIRQLTMDRRGEELDTALDVLGWSEALEVDRPIAIAALFEAQGEANATSSALDRVLSSELGLAEGRGATVVLPPLRSMEPPGRVAGARLTVVGLGTETLSRREADVIVVAAHDGAHAAFVVPTTAMKQDRVRGLDPALGLVELTDSLDLGSLPEAVPVDWDAAISAGQLALGHELVGTGRTMLELARVHALERIQFGRPIASFQAVRHRLAESYVALDAAAALLDAAWDAPDRVTAAMAKALAGRSVRTVARHAQQVLAGIGFTTEHSFHLFFRRAVLLDQILGAGRVLTRSLGEDTLATGLLPASLPL
jgi:hypothetical protein